MTAPDFIPLADVLRPRALAGTEQRAERHAPEAHAGPALRVVPSPRGTSPPPEPAVEHGVPMQVTPDDDLHPTMLVAVRDARLFRARLADAFDDAVARLLRELAVSVLARELRLAPCDLVAIARRVANDAPVVRLRLAPADASRGAASDFDLPVVEDPALDAGDAVLEVAGGAVDARLGVRLATLLEAVS